ncbi:MAG: glycosyltransferase [Candidatus Humimicrobiaceae bacterium]|jgi:glycosyltransferase involved in cell wall biosynthesis|nr:glycosyltransferase [Candidatus Humimicrobiaceae bacterium]
MKKIAIYDRYLSTAGGGERYSCKVAEILSKEEDFEVDIITDIFVDIDEVSRKLNLDLHRVNLKIFPFISEDYAIKITKKYDLFINATYLSSLPSYSPKSIYLCYFPTPFNVDFKFIHNFLIFFFRVPAKWLFGLTYRLTRGFEEVEVEEGLYEPRRFMLRRGSWTCGRALLKIKNLKGPLVLGFKNPVTTPLDLMKVNISVFDGEDENGKLLYTKDIELKKGQKKDVKIPVSGAKDSALILISSDTFTPSEIDKNSKDTRKLGVVIYDRRKINFFRNAILKISGYIPQFILSYPDDLSFLDTYDKIVTISEYSAHWVKKLWNRESVILFPPVDIENFKVGVKEKIILCAGRFFPEHHNKKQLEMVEIFKELVDQYPEKMQGYTLYLVGGVERRADHLEYVEKVKIAGKNYPVKVMTNIEWEKLVEIFAKSLIFWHAAGMGEDERTHPEKFEHFGITTVEAMAAGCIPVVINKGGQREIIKDGYNGFLFNSRQELKKITLDIIDGKVNIEEIRKNAVSSCRKFSNSEFEKNLILIVSEVMKD